MYNYSNKKTCLSLRTLSDWREALPQTEHENGNCGEDQSANNQPQFFGHILNLLAGIENYLSVRLDFKLLFRMHSSKFENCLL